MREAEDRLTELEGRLISHRRLLAHLLTGMDPAVRAGHLGWISEREILHDGQEDPGAVPTGTEALPLSLADEFREIAALVRLRSSDKG
jgi:hypothetical protein